ncbi:hypothetical protein ABZ930_35435 [Streptomyces sp. NPDC046716]|uniref:YqeB family protein n=1 Tax=Streptomyces sp. NPDC046716 TaxID=3157093 RepID=UPI003400515F
MNTEKTSRAGARTATGTTALAEPAWLTVLVCVAGGAVLGGAARLLAAWLVTLPWAPLQGPAELLTSVDEPWRSVGAVGVGALAGLLVGFLAVDESLSVTVGDEHVALTLKGDTQEFPRAEVAVAFRDGKHLVLLGPDGAEIAREESGLPWPRLAAALTAHGYRWADADPHGDAFARWVPGAAGLPVGADALLRARATARGGDGNAEEARELRAELWRLGVVVRDDKQRQYWRHAHQPSHE